MVNVWEDLRIKARTKLNVRTEPALYYLHPKYC